MRTLLDSHTLIWAVDDTSKLSANAHATVQDPNNDLLVSIASVWEIAIKVSLGRLSLSQPFHMWMAQALRDLDAALLPINLSAIERVSSLPHHHGDPFDRMLAAQSLEVFIPIISIDPAFDAYGVPRIW